MPEPTPPLDLAVIEARCAAATPGPWDCHTEQYINGGEFWSIYAGSDRRRWVMQAGGSWVPLAEWRANSHFIAHAREDVPALVARVRALEAEVARLQGAQQTVEVPYDVGAQPVAQCSVCGRFTWSLVNVERRCRLRQPDGLECPGLFL